MAENDFYLKVAFALSGCQLIEQELKLYISEALELAKKCIGNRLTFRMSGADYEDASLERLIDAFRKFTENDNLVKDLYAFKRERNFLSHQGISHCLDPDGELFETTAAEFEERLSKIEAEAVRLRHEIREEGFKFRGILRFGEFPDAA
jgi:hypothetical protein